MFRVRPTASLLCLIAVLTPSAGAQGPPTPSSAPATTAASEYVTLLDGVWNLVDRDFFDETFNGVDWPAARERYEPLVREAKDIEETARVINRMLDELKTSHTGFYTRFDTKYYELLDVFRSAPLFRDRPTDLSENDATRYETIGAYATQIDGQVFLQSVLDGGPADRARLRVGDRVISVDGKPWHEIRSFQSKAGQEVTVRVQHTPDEKTVEDVRVSVQSVIPHEMFLDAMRQSARMLPKDGKTIAYVHVWSYAGEHYQELLEELLQEGLRDADGLILDIRDGLGGANASYLNLFNQRVPLATFRARGSPSRPLDSQWRKPVVLLINERSRSGKEILAYGFKKYGYGKLVGTKTAGAVTAGRIFRVGGEAVLYLAVADVCVDGERLEGRGVEPDVVVPFKLPYANGNDPQLGKAVEVLMGQL